MMELLQFEKEYRVHVYETGPDGKLNLYSLFNYMQDIASDHAVKLGFGRDDLLRDNRFWVLSRVFAVIKEWPVWSTGFTFMKPDLMVNLICILCSIICRILHPTMLLNLDSEETTF